jgi:hypothetical protein
MIGEEARKLGWKAGRLLEAGAGSLPCALVARAVRVMQDFHKKSSFGILVSDYAKMKAIIGLNSPAEQQSHSFVPSESRCRGTRSGGGEEVRR